MRLLASLATLLALLAPIQAQLPAFTRGVYVLLADNTANAADGTPSTGDW